MARIWYSVFGEGFGHSTRSEVVIEELLKKHQLLITGCDILLALKGCPDGQLFASQKARRP